MDKTTLDLVGRFSTKTLDYCICLICGLIFVLTTQRKAWVDKTSTTLYKDTICNLRASHFWSIGSHWSMKSTHFEEIFKGIPFWGEHVKLKSTINWGSRVRLMNGKKHRKLRSSSTRWQRLEQSLRIVMHMIFCRLLFRVAFVFLSKHNKIDKESRHKHVVRKFLSEQSW